MLVSLLTGLAAGWRSTAADCFAANVEVRVLCEGVPGPGAVKASGGVSERPMIKGRNDVAVDRFHQACRFLASLGFPFPLRGYSDEE